MTRPRHASKLALAATLLLASCGKPEARDDSPEGSYRATSFIITANGQQTDQIANGSTIAIELKADGTTSGEIHVKASGDGPALDDDLTGTWTRSGDTIELHQRADTFLRDTPLAVRAGALSGDKTFGEGRIQITLSRID